MSQRRPRQNTSMAGIKPGWAIARAVWAAMLAMHLVWLVRSFGSPTAWFGQQAALAGAIAFFAIKTIDVAAFRIHVTRRSLIACVMIVALLHTGAIDRAFGDDSSLALWAIPALVSLPACFRLCRIAFLKRIMALAAVIGRASLTWMLAGRRRYGDVLIREHQRFLTAFSVQRAPPFVVN